MQYCAEEIALYLINYLYKKTKLKSLASGGSMNSVLNEKILDKTNFKNIFYLMPLQMQVIQLVPHYIYSLYP